MNSNAKQNFDSVLWDVDGTLVDSEPLHALSFDLSLESFDLSAPENFHAEMLGKSEQQTYAWLSNRFENFPQFEEWVATRYEHYLARSSELKMFPQAAELWHQNQRRGLGQGIVSNSDRMLVEANLSATGLATPNGITVTRNDVLKGKPDPEPYLRAAMLLGVEPKNCAVVEDSLSGMTAGLAAGMATFHMPNLEFAPPKNVRPLADLVKALEDG